MKTETLWSSKTDEWSTPQDLFDELDREFRFTLDACATAENHKCDMYFTSEQDGLKMDWGGYVVFCNPPYSQIGKWVKKAWEEARQPNTIVVLVIPARTDTLWFHGYIEHRAEVRFIKGRLRFGNATENAPFPSMVCIFYGPETYAKGVYNAHQR